MMSLIAKLHAYGFELTALKYICSYLSDRQQSTRINGTYSLFELLISGVPQGSILGPIIFNIFINDLFYFIKKANVHNYADDTTLSTSSQTLSEGNKGNNCAHFDTSMKPGMQVFHWV